MQLMKLNDYIYHSDYEELRDRPVLGYIKGENFSVVIDAGHSKKHIEEFYELLKANNLVLPKLTIITHWHWDHSFAIHSVSGLVLAERRTYDVLNNVINDFDSQKYIDMDIHIKNEYQDQEMIIKNADITFNDNISINNGTYNIEVFHVTSPHCDDCCLILIKEAKVLFIGDSICGKYPDWIVDKKLMQELINIIINIDFDISIGGHWDNMSKQELISYLESEL